MAVPGEVVHRRAVAEVAVLDDSELRERVESAVHGRRMDVGMAGLHALGERLRGHVVIGSVEKRGDDRTAGRGDASALFPDECEDTPKPVVTRRRHTGSYPWS